MLTIDFGVEGNSADFVARGWLSPARHFRWMTGVESELRFEQGFGDGDYIIEFSLIPFAGPPKLPRQRLTVSVNGNVVGQSRIARRGRFGYRIPAAAFAASHTTSVVLTHPDAARPCQFGHSCEERLLSLAVERLSLSPIRHGAYGQKIDGNGGIDHSQLVRIVSMSAARFILNFESLGNNCEFGILQRRCGAEPFLSLLRFARMGLPILLRALDAGMHDFGAAANLGIYVNEANLDDQGRPEYVVREEHYGVNFHTSRYRGGIHEEELRASESKRLTYFARRLVGDLKKGNKLFVIKRNVPLREDEILPLYVALSSYGRNVLLWVVPADAQHVSGSVEVVIPGLIKGFIKRFAPYDSARDLLVEDWLEICANAYQLSLADRMTARMGAKSSECQVSALKQERKIDRQANIPAG